MNWKFLAIHHNDNITKGAFRPECIQTIQNLEYTSRKKYVPTSYMCMNAKEAYIYSAVFFVQSYTYKLTTRV